MLEHLRVIELGQVIAGTFGDMILADLGAEVIKVEPPTGDAGRRSGIYGIGEESAIHLTNNRNKKSVALDLRTTEGRAVLLDLVRTADAVVENFRPGVLERLAIDYDRLRAVNPRIVLVSVSGFGTDSPYRVLPAYDLILQAMTGHMSIMGEQDRPPVIMGIPMADLLAGVFSAVALLAAVEARRETGLGTHIDIAMFDVMVEMLAHVGTLYLNTGLDQNPQGSAHPFITPWQAFRCSDDRYIVVAPREEHFWQKLCAVLGVEEIPNKPEFTDAKSRQAHRDVLLPLLESTFESRSSDHWLTALQDGGVPAAPVNRMPEMFSDKHIEVRKMIRSFMMAGQQMRTVGNAIKVVGRDEPESRRRRPSAATPKTCCKACSATRRSRSKRWRRRARSVPARTGRRGRTGRAMTASLLTEDIKALVGRPWPADHLRGRPDRHPGMGPRGRIRRPGLLRRVSRAGARLPTIARPARIPRRAPVSSRRAGAGPTDPRPAPGTAAQRERRDCPGVSLDRPRWRRTAGHPVIVDIKERRGSLGQMLNFDPRGALHQAW